MRTNVILGLVTLLVTTAATGTPSTAADTTGVGAPAHPTDRRAEDTAQSWSFYGTTLPIVAAIGTAAAMEKGDDLPVSILVGTGMIVGPSLGYFYGDCPGRGLLGIAIRCGICGLTAVAANGIRQSDDGSHSTDDPSALMGYLAVFGVGVTAVTVDAIIDIARVRPVVRQHALSQPRAQVSLIPVVCADNRSVGCALAVTLP